MIYNYSAAAVVQAVLAPDFRVVTEAAAVEVVPTQMKWLQCEKEKPQRLTKY